MDLKTPHAEQVVGVLEDAQDAGYSYAVWNDLMGWKLNPSDFSFFDTYGAAQKHWEDRTLFDDEVTIWDEGAYYFRSIEQLLHDIKLENGLHKGIDLERDKAKALLTTAGYRPDNLLAAHDRGTFPLIQLHHREIIDGNVFIVQFNFESSGMVLHLHEGYAGLFRVPLAHTVIDGFDTRVFEERLRQIDWAQDHPFLMQELPGDMKVRQLTTETVPAIYEDLKRLFDYSPEGRLLAEALLIRNISWHFSEDRNDPLQELTGEKYYRVNELSGIRPPGELYTELLTLPVPELDIAIHVERFIDRQLNYYSSVKSIPDIMNRNNLENIQEEMKRLGFNKKSIADAEQKMEKGLSDFKVNEAHPGTKGLVDVTAHFRQSGQSDNYYLNKFEVALNTGKPLEEGQKYFILSPNPEKGKDGMTKSFDNVTEAIAFFKEQKGDSKLGVGKVATDISVLAEIKAGKVDYVEKEFQRTFRTPAQTQTFFVERGKGFTIEQGVNLIQGRSVYRDDLLNLGGQPYAAWVKLDMDAPKDRYQNYMTNQYHVPTYGFVSADALEKYKIKEMDDPKKQEALIRSFENGNRPLITTVGKDGQEVKLYIEAAPRYHQVNFFQENGKPEKREQFLKVPEKDQALQVGKGKGQTKEQEQGIAV